MSTSCSDCGRTRAAIAADPELCRGDDPHCIRCRELIDLRNALSSANDRAVAAEIDLGLFCTRIADALDEDDTSEDALVAAAVELRCDAENRVDASVLYTVQDERDAVRRELEEAKAVIKFFVQVRDDLTLELEGLKRKQQDKQPVESANFLTDFVGIRDHYVRTLVRERDELKQRLDRIAAIVTYFSEDDSSDPIVGKVQELLACYEEAEAECNKARTQLISMHRDPTKDEVNTLYALLSNWAAGKVLNTEVWQHVRDALLTDGAGVLAKGRN